MQKMIMTVAALCLGTGAAHAEVVTVPPQLAADPHASVVQPTKQSVLDAAVTDCERMWDRGTHMTKRDWSQTCRRVQNRLQQLELR